MLENYTKTKTAFSFEDTLNNGETESKEIPSLGNFLISGLVSSTQDLTLTIEQGIDKKTKNYIKTTTISITANETKVIEEILYGNYFKISLANASGSNSTVKAFLAYRHENLLYLGASSPSITTINKKLDTLDTDTTAINSSSSYTSSWFLVEEYDQLTGMVTTDQDGSFLIEFSHDGSTALAEDSDVYTASEKKGFTSAVIAKYARFTFENTSGSNQASFSYVLYGRK